MLTQEGISGSTREAPTCADNLSVVVCKSWILKRRDAGDKLADLYPKALEMRSAIELLRSGIVRYLYTNIGQMVKALAAFPALRSCSGNHTLVADRAFRLNLQRPLLEDTKIVDERLPAASLILVFGRY